MAGKDECRLSTDFEGFDRDQVDKLIDEVEDLREQGLADKLMSIDDRRLAYLKKMRHFNIVNDAVKVKQFANKILDEGILDPLDLSISVNHKVNAILTNRDNYARAEIAKLEASLKKSTGQEIEYYLNDPKNNLNIYKELQAQRVQGEKRPQVSVTGDQTAYETARHIVALQDKLLKQEQSVGSTKGFLEGWVHKQRWDSLAMAQKFPDANSFYETMKDIALVDGGTAPKDVWVDIYTKIIQNRKRMPETDLTGSKNLMEAHFSGTNRSSMAETAGVARRIEFKSAEDYMKIADDLFPGETVYNRVLMDIEEQASNYVMMSNLGSDPVNNYLKAISKVMDETAAAKQVRRSLNWMIEKNENSALYHLRTVKGEHVLSSGWFQEKIPLALSRESDGVSSVIGAQVSALLRNITNLQLLQQSVFAAFTDFGYAAALDLQAGGSGNMFDGMKKHFIETFMALKDSAPVSFGRFANWIGKVADNSNIKGFSEKFAPDTFLEQEVGSLGFGIELFSDTLRNDIRFDAGEVTAGSQIAFGSRPISKVLENTQKGVNWFFNRANPMVSHTRIQQQINAFASMNRWGNVKNLAYIDLPDYYKGLLKQADISQAEWSLISKADATREIGGRALLRPEDLNSLTDEAVLKHLGKKEASPELISKIKTDLAVKYHGLIGIENRLATPGPDPLTKLRLTRGFKRGTVEGEAARLLAQLKQFSVAYTTNILVPLIRNQKLGIGAKSQIFAGVTAAAGLGMMMQQITNNKTVGPEYLTNPINISVALARGGLGVVGADAFIYSMASEFTDRPRAVKVEDFIGGPVIGGAVKNLSGASELIGLLNGKRKPNEIAENVLDFTYRNLPLINTPGVSIATDAFYDNMKQALNPTWKSRKRKMLKERGQEYIFK